MELLFQRFRRFTPARGYCVTVTNHTLVAFSSVLKRCRRHYFYLIWSNIITKQYIIILYFYCFILYCSFFFSFDRMRFLFHIFQSRDFIDNNIEFRNSIQSISYKNVYGNDGRGGVAYYRVIAVWYQLVLIYKLSIILINYSLDNVWFNKCIPSYLSSIKLLAFIFSF